MANDNPAVVTVFRVWRTDGDVIALFPALPADVHGRYCTSYMHVGQHSGADYHGVIRATRPATPAEYAPLRRELEQIGYQLIIRARYNRGRR